MSVALLLATLAFFDLLLACFRAFAGRDGRIAKRPLIAAALLRDARWAALLVAACAALVALLVYTASDPAAEWARFVAAGTGALAVFAAFATLIAAALALWLVPVHEIRILASITVLGPLTLIRPIILVGGLAWGAAQVNDPRVWIVAAIAAIAMLAFERLVGRRYTGDSRYIAAGEQQ